MTSSFHVLFVSYRPVSRHCIGRVTESAVKFFSLKLYDEGMAHRLKCYFYTFSIIRMSLALGSAEGRKRADFRNVEVIMPITVAVRSKS
jgi:hypothetical protein